MGLSRAMNVVRMAHPMDTQHFKDKLLEKERDLMSVLPRIEGETRISGDGEVGDSIDIATADQGTWTSVEEADILSHTLRDVRDALKRIEDGTYGTCTACGEQIGAARLEAVPWTPYCLKDQEKEDARGSEKGIDF